MRTFYCRSVIRHGRHAGLSHALSEHLGFARSKVLRRDQGQHQSVWRDLEAPVSPHRIDDFLLPNITPPGAFRMARVEKEDELSVLLERDPAQIPRGRALTEQMLPPAVPAGLPSELLQRRPDILQAEQQLTAATARIGFAQAERFPRITLTGLLGVASPQLAALGSGAFGSAGLGLAAPLFNAQALGFQQQAAEAQARQALAQYEQTVLLAFREVEDALVAVHTAREQTEAQEAQVASLRSALHLAELRYQGGLSNYLDVLTAKRNLFEVELSLTATRRLGLVSIIQLYKALGGGWSPGEAA